VHVKTNLCENIAVSLHHGLNTASEPLLASATVFLVKLAITYVMLTVSEVRCCSGLC
jgi:hypothetical protein